MLQRLLFEREIHGQRSIIDENIDLAELFYCSIKQFLGTVGGGYVGADGDGFGWEGGDEILCFGGERGEGVVGNDVTAAGGEFASDC